MRNRLWISFPSVTKQYRNGFWAISPKNVRKMVRLNELQSLCVLRRLFKEAVQGHPGYSPRWANGNQSGDQLHFYIFQKALFLQNNLHDQGKKKSDTEELNLLLWQVGEKHNSKRPRLLSRCLKMTSFWDVMGNFQRVVVSCEGVSLMNDIALIPDSLVVDEIQVLFL